MFYRSFARERRSWGTGEGGSGDAGERGSEVPLEHAYHITVLGSGARGHGSGTTEALRKLISLRH